MEFWSKKCKEITPYVCGEQPQDKQYIKLNTNENPYAPSPKVKKLLNEFDIDKLKLYPDPINMELRNAIAKVYDTTYDSIFVGNGSDEVLSFCFPAFFDSDGKGIAFADITYSFYPVYCDFYNIKSTKVELEDDFNLSLSKLGSVNADGYIICNPNAPTSIAIPQKDIIDFVEEYSDKLIIVDEAYVDFCDCSVIEFTKKYSNLLVVRTFSKSYSLAGVRCGYAVGNPQLIKALESVKNSINSYTVNRLTEKICSEAICDKEYFDNCIQKVCESRDYSTVELTKQGATVLKSSSNFLFVKHRTLSGKEVYEKLKSKGILVRFFDKARINEFVRISVGTMEEMKQLIVAFGEL